MQKIFKEFGGVIVTVAAIVALMGLVFNLLFPILSVAFGDITFMFSNKAAALIDSVPEEGTPGSPVVLSSGLYDANDNLVASWDELLHTYNWNPGENHNDEETYPTDPNSFYRVVTDNPELAAGVKLVYDPSADTIGMYSCAGVTQLKHIILPDVDLIEPYAFKGCTGLVSVKMGSVRAMGGGIFSGCSSLTTVELPDNMTKVPMSMFSGCKSITSFTIDDTVTDIQNSAFFRSGLTSIVIPDNVKTVGDMAFWFCDNLESVTLGAGVETIGDNAFGECPELKSITIPASVTYIGMTVFDGSGVTDIYYEGTQEQWEAITIDSWNDVLQAATIHFAG